MSSSYPTKRHPIAHRHYFWPLIVLLIAGVVLAGLELGGITHVFHKGKQPSLIGHLDTSGGGSDNNSKGEPQSKTATGTTPTASASTTQPGDNKSEAGGSSNATLITPAGDFVSAHHVQLTTPLTSVCNTTPGASCQILFTSNGITKSLTAETTDRGGSAYWNGWTPASIDLTAGSWQIQASANLGGQIKTASDAMSLVITQ